MSGYNMPDGVSPNMVPGNLPEDVRREEIEEKAWEDAQTPEGLWEALGLGSLYLGPRERDPVSLIWSGLRDMGDIHQRVYEMLLEKRMREEE